ERHGRRVPRGGSGLGGKFEIEPAAAAGHAFDANVAAVLAHDFLTDGQAQAGAARAFARFEHGKDALHVFGRDSFAVVGDDDVDEAVLWRPIDRDLDPGAGLLGTGVDGVGHDVQNGPVQQFRIELKGRQVGTRLPGKLNAGLLGAGFHQLNYIADRFVQVG